MVEKKKVQIIKDGSVSTDVKKSKIFQYSMKLSMLNSLLVYECITDDEYEKIKSDLMREYNIYSNLLCK